MVYCYFVPWYQRFVNGFEAFLNTGTETGIFKIIYCLFKHNDIKTTEMTFAREKQRATHSKQEERRRQQRNSIVLRAEMTAASGAAAPPQLVDKLKCNL